MRVPGVCPCAYLTSVNQALRLKVFIQGVITKIRGQGGLQQPLPPPEGEGVAEKSNFFFWFRLYFCVRVCGYSMTLNTNEKKNLLYLLTFIDKINNCKDCSMLHVKLPK